ncbi:MAG: GWxTD domain-containing protein [Rhodothermales bacterium]
MPVASSIESRLDVYTRVPYSSLQFISQGGKFNAKYTVLAELYSVDEKGNQQGVVASRIWERDVPAVTEYHQTLESTFDYTTHSISDVTPGTYVLEVQLEDDFASTSFLQKLPVKVRSFDKPAALSDVLLADSYDLSSRTIVPNVANVIDNDRGNFSLYYEILARQPMKARVSYSVFKMKKLAKPSVKSLLGLDKGNELTDSDVSFEALDVLPLAKGRNPATLAIPLEDFKVGDFTVRVKLSDQSGTAIDSVDKLVSVRWMGLDDQIRDVNQAVEQLAYIAKGKELDWIKSADSDSERARRFLSFWKKRDPTPITERNERMEEYYYRIAHANREYGNFDKGWQTDRGQVFVLYGEPDYITRHSYSFGASKPYEVWTYNSFGRRFIFVDKTGVGDYQLLVPIWDERTRIR